MNLNKIILKKLEDRLEHGQKEYGREVTSEDSRDWLEEAVEEALDLCVYLTADLIRIQENKKLIDDRMETMKADNDIGKSISTRALSHYVNHDFED